MDPIHPHFRPVMTSDCRLSSNTPIGVTGNDCLVNNRLDWGTAMKVEVIQSSRGRTTLRLQVQIPHKCYKGRGCKHNGE
jgi:hypothetical protein